MNNFRIAHLALKCLDRSIYKKTEEAKILRDRAQNLISSSPFDNWMDINQFVKGQHYKSLIRKQLYYLQVIGDDYESTIDYDPNEEFGFITFKECHCNQREPFNLTINTGLYQDIVDLYEDLNSIDFGFGFISILAIGSAYHNIDFEYPLYLDHMRSETRDALVAVVEKAMEKFKQ